MEDVKNIVILNLCVLPEYCINSQMEEFVECLLNNQWIRLMMESTIFSKPPLHEVLSPAEILSFLQLDKFIDDFWQKYLIQVLPKKTDDIFPLPRKPPLERSEYAEDLTFPELLHYVSVTNMKNLWNDSYNQFSDHAIVQQWKGGTKLHLEPYNKVLRDSLQRLYKCPIIYLSNNEYAENINISSNENIHPNIHPALCILEGEDHFFIIMKPSRFSVYHCINFSPSKLLDCELVSLFLLYQLLEAVHNIHELGLFIGNISLHHMRLNSDLHLTLIPCIYESLQKPESLTVDNDYLMIKQPDNNAHELDICERNNVEAFLTLVANKSVKDLLLKQQSNSEEVCSGRKASTEIGQMSLLQLTQLWATHEISNFDYLLSLSYFAGHSFDSPLYYPTLPWVTEFTSPNDWRDLTKSKYRLNKGDQQLNHTYELPDTFGHQEQIAHHIPEFFSEVTYYVYKARITPKQILQKHVRQHFVPSHYPVSIARMYTLTPEECIPEFYCDPTIFKSIHKDLPDLEVPSWCSGVHDFIRFHRQALESNYVSRRLHHWIDLYYGYKLSGSASVKARNVCLPLVDNHTTLLRGGIVQLFNTAHPPKLSPSPYLSKIPPPPCRGEMDFPREDLNSNTQKLFSGTTQTTYKDGQHPRINNSNVIELPQNYNPLTALTQLEMLYNFSMKLSTSLPATDAVKDDSTLTSKQMALHRRTKDMKVLACLIVQIFCPLRCRILNMKTSLDKRFEHASKVFQEPNDVPNSLHYFLKVIFGLNKEKTTKVCPVTYRGLPPPTSYQLLHPLFEVVSFPIYFKPFSSFVKGVKSYTNSLVGLPLIIDKQKKEEMTKNLTDSYMLSASIELKEILPQLSVDGRKLILPHIIELFKNPVCSVSAAWHLTDIVLKFLSPSEITKFILPLLIKLFESEVISKDHCKLFQQVYLLQLMVRLGLKIFLTHFVTPIIEAVGEYKICAEESKQHPLFSKNSPNLRNVDSNPVTLENLEHISPEEEEPGLRSTSNSLDNFEPRTSSLRSPSGVEADITDAEIDTEMFVFEGEELDDDTTVEDYEGAMVITNRQSRISLASDTESVDDGSLQEEIVDRSSLPSVCNSPTSLSLSGDEDMSNEDAVDFPKEDHISLGIPVPNWRIPDISSSFEFSRSLPESEKHHRLSVFKNSCEENDFRNKTSEHDQSKIKCEFQLTLSEMCCENVLWLSQKLGPVLTARHLTRNLLRMLTLCYAPESGALNVLTPVPEELQDCISITGKRIVGDKNAAKVLFCLVEIAELYGEQVILVQYLSHITELVGWCGSKFSSSQEGGLIGAMSLLQHLILHLSDTTFMDHLQETLICNAVYPVIRLLSSLKVFFPNGAAVRSTLTWRVMDSLYIMARRVGMEMSKEKLSPAITRFLSAFFKTQVDNKLHLSAESLTKLENIQSPDSVDNSSEQDQKDRNLLEMKEVFTPEMAYLLYVPFCKFLGTKHMEDILPSHELLRSLCLQYDESNQSDHASASLTTGKDQSKFDSGCKFQDIFGTDVAAVTGNRIDIKDSEASFDQPIDEPFSMETSLTLLRHSSSMRQDNKRHLKGNWLAYWEHEIGLNDQHKSFNLKQIKLQSFFGHTSSVKGIYVLDNENSIMSCSKDKTVKLWSLRSQGDGSAECRAQYTYTGHKKSVINITFCEPLQLAASCDSTVHIWDPFIGACLKQLDSLKHSPVTVLCPMSPPSTQLIAATTDSTLKIIDVRTCSYAQEMKITSSSVGLVRCLSTSQDSHLVGVAHSSGVIATLDLRTGHLLTTWKLHEGEVLTLQSVDKGTFISSALDQTISVWSVYDKKLKFSLKGPTEPVHLLRLFGDEVITGTTANRIGIHSSVSRSANFSSTRLRSETFRGVLTAMEVLPLNRQLLMGADNGSLQLIC